MMTSQKSFPSCSRVYCRMCIRKGRPLSGKVPNRKNLRCQCSSQGPALRQNGEIYYFFFWLVAAWVKSRAERPSVSGVNRQLHVQIGCKLIIRNRKDELTRQAERNKLQITNYKLDPKGIKGVNACRNRKRSS